MMVKLGLVLAALLSGASASPHHARSTHVLHRRDAPPSGFVNSGAAPDDHVINLKLALVQSDVSGLEQKVYALSTPGNAEYGQHLSKEEVEELVVPSSESVSAVNDWLASHNLTSQVSSPAGDVRSVNLTVKQANALLDASYSTFTNQKTGSTTIRTLSYSIPADLRPHINVAYPTTQFPPTSVSSQSLLASSSRINDNIARALLDSCATSFTPACALELYSIPTNVPFQSDSRLGIAGFSDQSAGAADLKAFLEKYRPDVPDSTTFTSELVAGGVNNQSNPGVEGNLDTQWSVGLIGQTVPVVFVAVGDDDGDDFFSQLPAIINAFLNDTNPPQVLSMSYSLPDSFIDQATASSICNGFAQLAARGISVLAASGDYGVDGGEDPTQCHEFQVEFPASCPYVTAVGGTISQGPEVAWNSSGSGFSSYFPVPSYQAADVAAFLKTLPANYSTGHFNASNRAFPDLSARADFVEIVEGESQTGTGTSSSTPIVASIFALLNAELIAAGKSPLGFLNPFIYANKDAFTDIVAGANPGCNSEGFNATQGWDAISGVGTPIYTKLRTAAGL
ncbi:hypothetical protein EVG20_g1419 [Dentipellis fragilis]|uniref:tripeptidyl-peptidase II n=1 Tax=Dentipellis fragilis TaxID=205917 RepID=A0A4Y9ZAK5_9AGAM|nr:hypothetical protein EVG20_g1419 [Dentipellis fragilis]